MGTYDSSQSKREPSASPRITRLLSFQQTVAKSLAPTLTGPIAGKRDADRPILLLAGPARSGRSTTLKAIQDTYRHTPIAVIAKETTPETTVVDLLALIVNRLGIHRRYRRYGLHKLDAFTVCFALLNAEDLKLPTGIKRDALVRVLRQLYFLRFARVHALLERSAQDSAPIAWWLGLVPRFVQFLIRGAGFAFYWRWKKRIAARLSQCSTLPPGDLLTQLENLLSLHHDKPATKEDESNAENFETAMCEVLLSDLDAFSRKHQRNAVSLVLVDDVDVDDHGHPTESGPRSQLLRRMARAHADYQGKRPWGPLAIIATCDGPPSNHTTFHNFSTAGSGADNSQSQSTPTPAEDLHEAVKSFHGNRSSEAESWFITWRLPLPNRSDVRVLCGLNATFRDDKPTLDWLRHTGQGDITKTKRLAEPAPNPSEQQLAATPTDLDRWTRITDLGTEHRHIDDYGHYRPPASGQQIRRRVYVTTATFAAASLLVGTAVVAANMINTWCDDAGNAYVSGPYEECVGISDGSYVFDDVYAKTFALIREENERVLADNPDGGHVSIAFLTPLTKLGNSANTDDIQSTLHQIQGAYEAQYQANHESGGKPAFEIRLLLANPGSKAEQWRPVVDDLIERKDTTPDNLIGVTGIGSSSKTSADMIDALSRNGIPTMSSVATADDLLKGKPGAFRVAPDNTAEARSMVSYLHRDDNVKTAMLVKDKNPDDPYTATLARAFKKFFPKKGRRIIATGTYTSNKVGVSENLDSVVSDVCSHRPDIVYFAGRGRGDLPDFILKLAKRNCRGFPIRIVTGDDASHVPDEPSEIPQEIDLVELLTKNDIAVEYSGLVHPWQWRKTTPHKGLSDSDRELSAGNVDRFIDGQRKDGQSGYRANFGEEAKLVDGQAMMAFDAVTVLIEGVRRLRQGHVDTKGLHNALLAVHDCGAVTSTLSGVIELDENGDTINKTMVIVRIDSRSVPKIVGLAWPDGKPTPIRDDC